LKTTTQHAFMVVTTIEPGHTAPLEELLKKMVEGDVEDNPWVPFKLLKTIHFARWFILPESEDLKGHLISDQLILSTNFDGPLDEHLAELVDVAGESGLDEIYRHCKGYPANPTNDDRIAYLLGNHARYSAFYVGTVGRTVTQIRQESELRDAIQVFLDSRSGWDSREPSDIRKAIQEYVFVERKDDFEWAQTPPPPWLTPRIQFIKNNLVRMLVTVVVLIVVLLAVGLIPLNGFLVSVGVILALVLVFLAVLRYKEERDQEFPLDYSCPTRDLIDREDHIVQNQLTIINYMKPGFFRLTTERVVQAAVNFLARYFLNEGMLGGIPSIHFARWVIIDDGRRLLFMSNFDGSWENYLGDFVDKAADGLTAVWSNTVHDKVENGFPKTKWLFLKGGARDEQRFKAYSRACQVTTDVWYSAYKELSVQNINNNSMIHAGLYGDLSPKEITEWLNRL